MNLVNFFVIIIIILNELESIKANKTRLINNLKIDISNDFNNHQQFPSTFKCLFNNFTILFIDDLIITNKHPYKTYSSVYIQNLELKNNTSNTNYKSTATLYQNFENKNSNFKIFLTLFQYYNDNLVEVFSIIPHYSFDIISKSLYLMDNLKIDQIKR
jgi:hypothetical protein